MKHLTKVLLIVVAIFGLTVGMSTITGCSNSSDETKAAVSDNVGDAKADVKDAKCGEGKCGEGKCGGDDAKAAVSDKVDEAKTTISDKVDEAKCGEGKCG